MAPSMRELEADNMRLKRICVLLFPASAVVLCGCGAALITAEDVVVTPGRPGDFVVYLDRHFGKASVGGAEVELRVDGKKIGRTITDSDGMAHVRAALEGTPSSYSVRVRLGQEVTSARGRIFHWDLSRTAVAIDVDETISATDYGSLFLTDLDTTSPHLKYSPAAVQAMAPYYDIVYLSARPRWLHEKTKLWLDAHRFPPGPILHASRFEACFQQERYKRRMLAEFQRDFPNLLVGVGDKGVDDRAYGANGMLAVILEESPNGYRDHCVVLPDWLKVRDFFLANRDSLADATHLQRVIHSNNMELRWLFAQRPLYMEQPKAAVAAGTPPRPSPPAPSQRPHLPETRTSQTPSRQTAARRIGIYGYQ